MVRQPWPAASPARPQDRRRSRDDRATGTVIAELGPARRRPRAVDRAAAEPRSRRSPTETLEIAHHGFFGPGTGGVTDEPAPVAFTAAGAGRRPRAAARRRSSSTRSWSCTSRRANGRHRLSPGRSCGRITFQFNPKELTLTKSAKWERDAQKNARRAACRSSPAPEPCKLSLEMFFDASDTQDGSVVKPVEQLFACCVPTDESQQQKKGSPAVGGLPLGRRSSSFTGLRQSVSARSTRCSPPAARRSGHRAR